MKPYVLPDWENRVIRIIFWNGTWMIPFYSKLGNQLYSEWLERNYG